jgi:hypothetical protein
MTAATEQELVECTYRPREYFKPLHDFASAYAGNTRFVSDSQSFRITLQMSECWWIAQVRC